MAHEFRKRLLQGDVLVGTMVTLPTPAVAELLGSLGYDWLFLDAEHSVFDAQLLQAMVVGAATTPCLVRVSHNAELPIKQALDVGAAGIIVPQVNSAAQAAQVVQWAKYPPTGTRGVGIARAHGYGWHFRDAITTANDTTAVIIQAEHSDAVQQIEAIVQVPGIDAVLIGPYDLSGSLGRLGELDHPSVGAAIDHVTQVCQAAGMRLGMFGVSVEAVQPYRAQGYTLIVAGVDTLLLAQAAHTLLNTLKQSA